MYVEGENFVFTILMRNKGLVLVSKGNGGAIAATGRTSDEKTERLLGARRK